MCKFVDEFLLVAMLMVQLVAGLPVIALTKMVGIVFLAIYMVGIFFSISLVFATKFRLCCKGFAYFANEHGIFFFLIVHLALISLISYTTYMFTYPFFKGNDFKTFCDVNNLDENLSRTGCEKLQGESICNEYRVIQS
jgi:hypothetical protein